MEAAGACYTSCPGGSQEVVCHFIAEHFAAVWLLMVAVWLHGVGHVLLTHTWALVQYCSNTMYYTQA